MIPSLKLGYWNVNLTPPRGKSNKENIDPAIAGIIYLISEEACNIIGLSEVSEEDLLQLNKRIAPYNFGLINLTRKANGNKSRFDNAIIYNKSIFKLTHVEDLITQDVTSIIKVANVLEALLIGTNSKLTITISHWPSRIHPQGKSYRYKAASALYNYIEPLMRKNGDIILMGDFNDNPFDKSLQKELYAERCIEYVQNYPKKLIYNPFWRAVTPDKLYSISNTIASSYPHGSFRYKNNKGVWNTFDQIMVSGSMLGGSVFHLEEKSTKVLNSGYFVDIINNNENTIDHLPVVCLLTNDIRNNNVK